MMKKTICLISNWFPTKDNPYRGLFFKEQAYAVSDEFDFVVLRFNENHRIGIINHIYAQIINRENNIVEYDAGINYSIFLLIYDMIYNQFANRSQKKKAVGIGKYMSPLRKKIICKSIVKIYRNMVRDPFDVLYCVDAQKEAFYCYCLSREYNKPYVVSEHAPFPSPGSLIVDANKEAIEAANLFFAISSDKIRQVMLQNIVLPKTVYIGNLIDERKLELLKVHNNTCKTFIIMAAHSYYKNYDMFIKVMNRLYEIADSKFKVMIVGYASNKGYSINVDEFEEDIKKTSFSEYVEMIPEIPHEEISNVLNKADAFVLTSIQEGQPVSALEAACCGLPIFSTRCGGVEDYVDNKMGRIYHITDVEGMAQDLNRFIKGELIFDNNYIRNQVVNKFGFNAFREKFIGSFNDVLNDV